MEYVLNVRLSIKVLIVNEDVLHLFPNILWLQLY